MSIFSKITEMPWLASTSPSVNVPMTSTPAKKVGLRFFLAVVTSMFFLFVAAYIIRMDYGDWRPLQDSSMLWVNTLLLVAGSIAFQLARNAAEADQRQSTTRYLATAGVLTLMFLGGQIWVWLQINATALGSMSNPASAFFLLLTSVHGLHLLGGLYVWLKTLTRIALGHSTLAVKLSVELCSVYWHFLLLVWLVVFALLLAT
jgi:cytochrome c oxidase subunit 3